MNETCPCCSNKIYNYCCGIIHNDIRQASTAKQLMRSRYTAFTLANGSYLKESHHPSTRPQTKKALREIVQFAQSVEWRGLEIIETKLGGPNDENGIVEFKAHFSYNGTRDMIHEVSRFKKENGIWYYLNAIQ